MSEQPTIIDTVNISYGGSDITVDLMSPPGARLTINRITRASEFTTPPGVIRLSSTVQTDYEWHEFIEAVIEFKGDAAHVAIDANNQRIADQQFSMQTDETP